MITPLILSKLLSSVTGVDEFAAPGYLFRAAERVYNLERAFNVREKQGRQADVLPERMQKERLVDAGPAEGQTINAMEVMLDEYYRLREWTEEGVPSPEKLRVLGLDMAALDMEQVIDSNKR
jgi:aldehyde:ferredoxin oxidoreductase